MTATATPPTSTRTTEPPPPTPAWVWAIICAFLVVTVATISFVVSNEESIEHDATIVTSAGEIVLDLNEGDPAADRFEELAEAGVYDETTITFVARNAVIAIGDSSAASGEAVTGIVPETGYSLGSLIAASDVPGEFDQAFYIVTGPEGQALPTTFASFGKVVEGIDVAREIEGLAPTQGQGEPTEPVTIERIEISG